MLTNLRNKVIPLFSKSQALLTCIPFKQPTIHSQYLPSLSHTNQRYCFSTFFSDLDKTDVHDYSSKKFQNKKYRGLIALWKKPLEQKRKRQ